RSTTATGSAIGANIAELAFTAAVPTERMAPPSRARDPTRDQRQSCSPFIIQSPVLEHGIHRDLRRPRGLRTPYRTQVSVYIQRESRRNQKGRSNAKLKICVSSVSSFISGNAKSK